jgi:L-lactate dehydrogenase complex protein LldF
VKINIHEQLWFWRQDLMKDGLAPLGKSLSMKGMAFVFSNPTIFKMAGYMGRIMMRFAPFLVNNKLNPWFKQREMPEAPKESFQSWYKNRK